MKEATVGRLSGTTSSGGVGGRSESDKEKTKMRERQRRAITSKIFHGLRKHGGYSLPPRADINEVLRELAKEAGWVIEPDGTTYRSSKVLKSCPVCCTKTSTTPTPASSTVIGGGGDCSRTASPLRVLVEESMGNVMTSSTMTTSMNHIPYFPTGNVSSGNCSDLPVASLYMYAGIPGGFNIISEPSKPWEAGASNQNSTIPPWEVMASNENTPVGSPLHHTQLSSFDY
ncbi:hypothetical protein ACFE04_030622 [Oxalis oulophora]